MANLRYNLRYKDKITLKKVLGMSDGYVLDFLDKAFEDFIDSIFSFNIHAKYTGSRAYKMREIWKNESNANVAKLLTEINDIYFKDSLSQQTVAAQDIQKLENDEKYYHAIEEVIRYLTNQSSIISTDQDIEYYKHLTKFIAKAQKHLNDGDYWEVITASRTILEITFKEIYTKKQIDYNEKNIINTYKNIKKCFQMDSLKKEYPDFIKNLINNTAQIVQNIEEARNKSSSSHAPIYKLKHHTQFILDQSISTIDFMISVSNI